MSDNKFDLNKLKENMSGLVGSLKSMINPAGGTPVVDPDDALGLKIAEITTKIKEMVDAQNEHVKNLGKLNELLNSAFQDIQALRQSVKTEKEKPTAEKPVKAATGKKDEKK